MRNRQLSSESDKVTTVYPEPNWKCELGSVYDAVTVTFCFAVQPKVGRCLTPSPMCAERRLNLWVCVLRETQRARNMQRNTQRNTQHTQEQNS